MTLEQYKIIQQQLKAGIGPAKTYTFLKQAYPMSRMVMKDVYNARERIKFQTLKGQSRLQVLLHELQNAKDETGEEKWNYDSRKNKETSELTGLFFSHLRSGSMFMRYPEVVHIDATFKVNRFNVPLLSIVGTTGLNTTFQIASIFLVGKHQDDYF
jgi:hypothetical protein